MKSNDTYYLFDSHSRGPKGFVAPVKGTSMLMKFPDLSALCEHLEVALQVRRCKDMQYSMTALSAFTNIISPLVTNEQALIPIDTNVPNLTEIVTNADIGERPIPIYELKRKTVPPISLLKEQRAEELAWTKLFPDGRNGLREQRSVNVPDDHRSHSLEHLSLGEFAVWYDVVSTRAIDFDEDQQDADAYDTHNDEVANVQYIILLDNVGRMKKRSRPAILRTRYFTLASDPEAYYYSLILTHVPTEEELLEEFDSAKEAFWARPLHEGFDAEGMAKVEVEIQQAISRIVAENLAAGGEGQQNIDINFDNDHQPIDCLLDDVEQIIIDEFQEPNDVSMSDIQFETAVTLLNFSQRHLFQSISQKLLDPTNQGQLLIFVTGGAGTGKTFTLKVMTEQIRRLSCVGTGKRVAVIAPTGVAARIIGGSTLHSTFALPIEKGRVEARPITEEGLQREQQKWRSIEWLIIDEISMVPYLTLRNINIRLQQLKQDQGLFGGINIILFGDLMQLPPVSKTTGGAYCFRQPPSLTGKIDLWRSFSFCELPQNVRQAGDNTFVDILNNIRVGELTMYQLKVLDSRRIPLVGTFAGGEAVRIFPTTKLVDAYNSTMTTKLGKSLKLYHVNAVDISLEMKTYGQCPRK
ncbi:unnamed protein product [Euphydryas editha]|uniref:ATP-dependent DNA helicase n=1 Tax=Euphydryas editha TaxID=104508 RepID=A0AAU9UBH3_EUPED|nr:unnamed protein product [Euphydryas editha]